jgi:hypothetical protein
MLAGTACVGAVALTRTMPAWTQAAAAGHPPVCLTMYYMLGDGASFDRLQFRQKQMPLLRSLYGDSLDRIELRTAPRGPRVDPRASVKIETPQLPILAMVSLWVRSLESYAAATQRVGDQIAQGMKGITDAKVAVQWEQLIAEDGEARASVVQGTQCNTTLYPSRADGTWDAKHYTETYLPMVKEAYGPDVLRRIEVCKGISVLGGGTPVFVSAVHMYLKDPQYFMSKGMQAGQRLMPEVEKFTNIVPVTGTYDVYAVG